MVGIFSYIGYRKYYAATDEFPTVGILEQPKECRPAKEEVVVKLRDETPEVRGNVAGVATTSFEALNTEVGGARTLDDIPEHAVALAQKPEQLSIEETIKRYEANPAVEYAEPNWCIAPTYDVPNFRPNDPYFWAQWHLSQVEATNAWYWYGDNGRGVSPITVAVLDSGVDAVHPDLAPVVLPGWNTRSDNNDWSDAWREGHGTQVAGLIAAITNNAIAISGAAPNVKILPVRISNSRDQTSAVIGENVSTFFHLAKGIYWATDHGAKVINVSWTAICDPICWLLDWFGTGPQLIRDAVDYAWARNTVIVAAMGNIDVQYRGFPAAFKKVIAVGATDRNDRRACWPGRFLFWRTCSTYGSWIDVSAPGEYLLTICPWRAANVDGVCYFGGTSGTTPIVSALAALVLSARPDSHPAEVDAFIKAYADDIDLPGFDKYTGYGRVNFRRTIAALFPSGDTTGPTLSGVQAASGESEATISWRTDEPATSAVEFSTSATLGARTTRLAQIDEEPREPPPGREEPQPPPAPPPAPLRLRCGDELLVIEHALTLPNLALNTTYYYRVTSRDLSGNLTTSPIFTFTTHERIRRED